MVESENYSGGEVGEYCGNPNKFKSAEGAQRFGRASGSQTQPRVEDLRDVPQKFQPVVPKKQPRGPWDEVQGSSCSKY